MFKKGQVSTEVDKGPFIFTLVALVVGLTVTVLLFALGRGAGLAVFAGVLFAIVTLSAAVVLFALLTDKAYIDDCVLYTSYMFKKRAIKLDEIGKISYKDDVYTVFDKKGNRVSTINAKLTSIGEVIFALDKAGVDFN
ncbi:MAG: hypothetical protein IKQ18_03900 [Clostridia bacterium]|nr:hypothetical protein [Clostridia bacterium]